MLDLIDSSSNSLHNVCLYQVDSGRLRLCISRPHSQSPQSRIDHLTGNTYYTSCSNSPAAMMPPVGSYNNEQPSPACITSSPLLQHTQPTYPQHSRLLLLLLLSVTYLSMRSRMSPQSMALENPAWLGKEHLLLHPSFVGTITAKKMAATALLTESEPPSANYLNQHGMVEVVGGVG